MFDLILKQIFFHLLFTVTTEQKAVRNKKLLTQHRLDPVF